MKPSSAPSARRPSRSRLWAWGAAVFVCVAALLGVAIYGIVTGKTRSFGAAPGGGQTPTTTVLEPAPADRSPRNLDGLAVSTTVAALRPWAFMIDNQVDARPAEGLEKASVVIEAPVEGGITRFLALFDPGMAEAFPIGPVRSARPYFVEWAGAWKAVFGHVGGSPEALERLAQTPSSTVLDVNEMIVGSRGFWRDPNRVSPHQVLTNPSRFAGFLGSVASSTALFAPWRFTGSDAPTSTVSPVSTISVPYGGSYSVRWLYDENRNAYRRAQSGRAVTRSFVYAANVVILKTDAQTLDDKGRLRLRTTGSGEMVLYRDGRKFIGRWSRAAGEMMRFTGTDGADFELRPGVTWIEVTTDDAIFAGV